MIVSTQPALSDEQRETARRVSEHLRSELGLLLGALPLETRTIAAVAEYLRVTPPVCQRLLRGVRHRTSDALDALPFFPGVRGLRQVTAAARRLRMERALIEGSEAAVAGYARLIDAVGGSQAQLVEALNSDRAVRLEHAGDPDPSEVLTRRQAAFEAQRLLTRRELATQVATFLYRPLDDDPDRIDCVTAMGLIGLRRQLGCLPLCPVQTYAFGGTQDDPLAMIPRPIREGAWTSPLGLLEEFCTQPSPPFLARQFGGRVPLLIDPEVTTTGPVDLVLGTQFKGVPSPLVHAPRTQFCSLISEGPARTLILQAHLHRSMAQRSVAAVDAYSIAARGRVGDTMRSEQGHAVVDRPEDRWFDRLPDRPPLEYLGVGLGRVGTEAWKRNADLTSTLFELQGWDPEEFVAYRTVVHYPVWGAQYLLSFDFGEDSENGNSSPNTD